MAEVFQLDVAVSAWAEVFQLGVGVSDWQKCFSLAFFSALQRCLCIAEMCSASRRCFSPWLKFSSLMKVFQLSRGVSAWRR